MRVHRFDRDRIYEPNEFCTEILEKFYESQYITITTFHVINAYLSGLSRRRFQKPLKKSLGKNEFFVMMVNENGWGGGGVKIHLNSLGFLINKKI